MQSYVYVVGVFALGNEPRQLEKLLAAEANGILCTSKGIFEADGKSKSDPSKPYQRFPEAQGTSKSKFVQRQKLKCALACKLTCLYA